jgi:tRNA threonylcarbamoyladenosine biosynthesis protein TsaE
MEKVMHTLDELHKEATSFLQTLSPKVDSATLVTLSGELGAGKTAFTKMIAKELGVEDSITSPTFVLEKIYPISNNAFKRLIHIDAYRLELGSDLAPLGFDEVMKDSSNLVFLEWPEKVRDALPLPAHALSFVAHDDGSRTLTYG